jgi:hypothetical protein
MLNDGTKPNKKEISLLYDVFGEMQGCRRIALEGVSKISPLIVLALVEGYSDSDKIWAQATSGKLTWGQFNESRKSTSTQTQAKLIQANAQIVSQLQGQHQLEMAHRQRAIESVQQWVYQQQVLENQRILKANAAAMASRPITCNFNQLGPTSTMTCNKRSYAPRNAQEHADMLHGSRLGGLIFMMKGRHGVGLP